jgi:hypothetical protein
MEANSFLGIWLDHSSARFFAYDGEAILHQIESPFTHQNKMESLSHSESGMHHKEHQQQEQYFKIIGNEILKYKDVLLFGNTDAKLELHNYLLKNHHFDAIKFEIKSADKMTDSQQKAFVKNYFAKTLK